MSCNILKGVSFIVKKRANYISKIKIQSSQSPVPFNSTRVKMLVCLNFTFNLKSYIFFMFDMIEKIFCMFLQ